MKKVLKPVTCMAFGYLFLLMALSEMFPVTAPLTLTVALFTPFMERREQNFTRSILKLVPFHIDPPRVRANALNFYSALTFDDLKKFVELCD